VCMYVCTCVEGKIRQVRGRGRGRGRGSHHIIVDSATPSNSPFPPSYLCCVGHGHCEDALHTKAREEGLQVTGEPEGHCLCAVEHPGSFAVGGQEFAVENTACVFGKQDLGGRAPTQKQQVAQQTCVWQCVSAHVCTCVSA